MTPEEFDTKWGPKTAFKTIGRHGEFVKDLANVLAAERERIFTAVQVATLEVCNRNDGPEIVKEIKRALGL